MSTTGSALLNTDTYDRPGDPAIARAAGPSPGGAATPHPAVQPTPGSDALKRLAAERLAAHRSRRNRSLSEMQAASEATADGSGKQSSRSSRSSRIAAAVAERYAQSPSYRAVLAEEAERAIRHAQAAAEIAAVNAKAVATAQQMILDELGAMDAEERALETAPPVPRPESARGISGQRIAETPRQPAANREPVPQPREANPSIRPSADDAPAVTVRLPEHSGLVKSALNPAPTPQDRAHRDPAHQDPAQQELGRRRGGSSYSQPAPEADSAEVQALDAEIAFRQDPVFEDPPEPPTALPANLIEFPRQLVAPRKARPRYAEGPLRDDADASPEHSQLSIFEVEPEQLSSAPAVEEATPEWTSIWLDALQPAIQPAPVDSVEPLLDATLPEVAAPPSPASAVAPAATFNERLNYAPRPQSAPISHRIMAATVDFCVVAAGLLGFATTFALTVGRSAVDAALSGRRAEPIALAALAAGSYLVLNLAYKALFFTLSDATPGMRYARIDLCTLSDGRPAPEAIRRRIFAGLPTAFTLGAGLVWALFDDDGLSWQDRLSGLYQRSY